MTQRIIETMAALSNLESMIPDAMLLTVASYLEGDELMRFEIISKKFHSLKESLDKETWKEVCHRRWREWPRYRWENLKKSHLRLTNKTWKQRYLWVEADYSRKTITIAELEGRSWWFNFTPQAGGRGLDTLTRCFFGRGFMVVPGFPPFHCRLVNDGEQQRLYVHNFPPQTIERLTSNGEWVMKNQNVTCVSSHETDTPTYRDRGFQG